MIKASLASGEILVSIRKIVRAINLESKKVLREYGVSIPQILCLSFLDAMPDKQATLKEIAVHLQLSSSTVSGLIDRIERKGYVARLPKRGDRRTTLITLTSSGEKVLRNTPPLLQDRLTRHLNDIPAQEISLLTSALDRIIGLLGIESVEASPILATGTDFSLES